MTLETTVDVALVGGGLANVLIALRLAEARPGLRLAILERGPVLGGNHTWSFHDSDVSPAQLRWLSPLITSRWATQEVRFPGLHRVLDTGYNSILSDRLHEVATAKLGATVHLDADVTDVTPHRVSLADGRAFKASCVVDGRGALRDQPLALGYQKFVGLEIETTEPHGQERPIIMDATVAQHDGYRFVYTLPFSATTIMVEDTYYSEGSALDPGALEARVHAYIAQRGWTVARVIRREAAVLPITLAGDIDAHWRKLGQDLPRSGLRAWLFHPTTGYSLPYAVRLADLISAAPDLASGPLARAIETYARREWSRQTMFRFLNRMLFLAARPGERVGVLERFYRLPEPLIRRFYAGELTVGDRARILSGRPPLPLSRALRFMGATPAWTFAAARGPAAHLG